MQQLIETQALTMSTLEIAELCDKRHDNVMRDIKNVFEELKINDLSFEGVYKDKKTIVSTHQPVYYPNCA